MTLSRKYISWQPVLTDHQAYTYLELSHLSNSSLIAYVTKLEDETRRSQGWSDTQVQEIERRLIPKAWSLFYCYRQLLKHRNDIHIFSSAFQEPKMILCLFLALWLGNEVYIISEPYSPVSDGYFYDKIKIINYLKSKMRPIIYKLYTLIIRNKISGLFAISRLAVSQYRRAGVPKNKVFPFGYFIPKINTGSSVNEVIPRKMKVIFVGSLITRKGIDILITAANSAQARGGQLTVDVFGPGDPHAFHFDDEIVRYRGYIPFGTTQQVVSNYDLLVLPSRYDGWGVVVNEALCAGVPVLCSNQVGASAVVEHFDAGLIFPSGNSKVLSELLLELCNDRSRLKVLREAALRACNSLQPAIAAEYMLRVIQEKPKFKADISSPWYSVLS